MVFPYRYTPVENLIDGQLATNGITHTGIIDAIRSVPRELFVPEPFRHTAYVDEEIPVGAGRVMIEPLLLATLLQHLDPKPYESGDGDWWRVWLQRRTALAPCGTGGTGRGKSGTGTRSRTTFSATRIT